MQEWARYCDEAANHQLPIAVAFCIIQMVSVEECSNHARFDADLLLYSLSHFECSDHTVHMLTQWCLPPPLISTVKLLLFMPAHSSPLSLAAGLHRCCANHFCYINNGWAFSGQTSYTPHKHRLSYEICSKL